jgi:hypothetical protein
MIASYRSVIVGLAIAAVGSLWPWITRLGLGRLAGDIFIQRDNFTFYAPIQPFCCLHDCSGCFRLERLPGGACTHWKAPPCHGARQ